ncbi:FAD-binding oxidoreductase [Actinomadura hibisca]|uniref:FAD-binding oxidoreductase n=1 Tax=Actinomadura hibisca TaxID=68565 RepID=UPI000831752B|nr:FAD-binding oxidoreductase [Actinomadura hibisca]
MDIANELRKIIDGTVLAPGDHGFDRARRPWNLTVDQPVRAVVEAAHAADVAALVRHARLAGLTVTAQPSGHGASGTTDGLILLRTGRLDELTIDPQARTARAGAGVKWGQVLKETSPHGLLGLAGSSPVVSVTGYTLGGGLSWFGRKHGWAADHVRAFDVVDADGTPARVTADSDPDLFWALRGGGGDYALVTAIEFDLHPAPVLYGGRMVWSADHAPALLDAYREVTATAPDELTVWYELLQIPGAPPTVVVDSTFLGDAATAEDLLRPFEKAAAPNSDTRAVLPIADLGTITAEPTDPAPGRSRAELLTGVDDRTAATLLERPIDPLLTVQLRHLGGALSRPADNGGATGPLTEPHALYMLGAAPDRDAETAVRERQDEIATALLSQTSGRKPYTFLAPGETAAAAFTAGTLERLRDVKRSHDPHGVFRANYPIPG